MPFSTQHKQPQTQREQTDEHNSDLYWTAMKKIKRVSLNVVLVLENGNLNKLNTFFLFCRTLVDIGTSGMEWWIAHTSVGDRSWKGEGAGIIIFTGKYCHGLVLAEEPEDSRVTIKIAFNIINRQEDRKTGTRVQHSSH